VPRKSDEAAALRRLGDIIVRRRTVSGRTQELLAEAAHISVQFLRRIERGTGNPSYLTLRAIARGLGTELGDIMRDARAGD
jgi:transcriptional regulator with XRE-family HTH domain